MKLLAERIKYLREEKELTQQQLGEAVGYDQSRVAKWESGSLEPNVDVLIALAKVFNVTVGYLVGTENDQRYYHIGFMMNKFAERVVGLLQENNLTKYQLAMDTGISKSVMSDYCSGKVQPTADVIIVIAKYLNVSTDYLLGLTNDFE